jgi:hypothetical protein
MNRLAHHFKKVIKYPNPTNIMTSTVFEMHEPHDIKDDVIHSFRRFGIREKPSNNVSKVPPMNILYPCVPVPGALAVLIY